GVARGAGGIVVGGLLLEGRAAGGEVRVEAGAESHVAAARLRVDAAVEVAEDTLGLGARRREREHVGRTDRDAAGVALDGALGDEGLGGRHAAGEYAEAFHLRVSARL